MTNLLHIILCRLGFHKWVDNYDWKTQHLIEADCEYCGLMKPPKEIK